MNLKHLEYFTTVARMGSINKAAQVLFISQPHLGKIIQELERTAGAPLFIRSSHGVTLTPEGMEFQRRALRVLEEIAQMVRSGDQSSPDGALSVSMTKYSHIMESFIAVVLRHKDLPAYAHRLQEGNPHDVLEDVYDRQAQVGVLHFSQSQRDTMLALIGSRQLSYSPLARVTPHILLSSSHPLLQQGGPITLERLSGYGFARYLGQYEDFTYHIFSQGAQFDLSYSPRIVYLSTRASLLHLLSNSDFYSIGIHDFRVQQSSYQVVSIPIQDCRDMLEFGYVTPSGVPLSGLSLEFIQDLKHRLI